jgi:hypothetical protein
MKEIPFGEGLYAEMEPNYIEVNNLPDVDYGRLENYIISLMFKTTGLPKYRMCLNEETINKLKDGRNSV